MRVARSLGSALALALGACGGEPTQDEPTDDAWLVPAVDASPDDSVFETTLTARPGSKQYGDLPATPIWGYDGLVPGPLLDVRRGDTLRVHLANELPASTTVHWHGIRLPATMDGVVPMQAPIEPGATFDYEFPLKDAGLYWFHPHLEADEQVQRGLHGALRVRGDDEPVADVERVLVLDDIDLKEDGTFPTYLDDEAKMMGREGDLLLVNGLVTPTLVAPPGATLRLRLVNVANGRFFHLRVGELPLVVLGGDGPRYPSPRDATHVLLAPGDRADVMVRLPAAPGEVIELVSDPYERGHHSGDRPPALVGRIELAGAAVQEPAPLPTTGPELELLPDPTDPADTIAIELTEGIDPQGELAFYVNGLTYPDVPPVMVPLGAIRALEVTNGSEMDHPFHLHGFFFQEIARAGVPVPAEERGWEDTVIVPAETTLRLVARFDEPGMWMYHCHILEHAELGMMGEIHVE